MMRKWCVTVLVVAVGFVPVHADVTLAQTMTMEGGPAAAMGGGVLPRVTTRIKGQKSRSDFELNGQTVSSIADLSTGQLIMLNAATKTATVTTASSTPVAGGPVPMVDVSLKPTGKTQAIDGQQCHEHALKMTISMADFAGGGQLPPEALAMMKDINILIDGSSWIARSAPGAAEFTAFSKTPSASKLLAGVLGGQSTGLEKLMEAIAGAPGVPYLTEFTMTFEGSGPLVEAMKQMGPMKMVQKVESVSTAPLADDLFSIPAGYTIEKK